VNNLNQYTVVDSINQTYDKNGNLVHDGSFGYRWDYRNRLRQVCTLDLAQRSGIDGVPGTADDCSSAGARVISVYTYDALDRRIRKSVTSSGPLNGATNFYYDRWRTIEERDSADVLLRQAVYGVYTDELLALDTNQDGNNTAIGAADRRLFYHQNGIGSIAALSDATRTVVEGYQYAAYGNQIVYGPVFGSILSTAGSVANPYRFTGQRFDPETGLFYFRKRQLSPWLGDFISRDPGGIWHDDINVGNAYAYVGDAPTKLTDWDGKGGFTNCNRMKGEMVTVNNTQGCPRICTEEHEEVHRNDGAVCCLKYSEKYKAAPDITAKNALTNKWNEWINSQEDWAECRGYTKSVDCADRKLKENKCAECPADKPEGTAEEQDKWRVQRKCCDELNKYKEEAEKLKKKHCDDNKGGKATQPACPF
jgi:RHS repeat-associated protein